MGKENSSHEPANDREREVMKAAIANMLEVADKRLIDITFGFLMRSIPIEDFLAAYKVASAEFPEFPES